VTLFIGIDEAGYGPLLGPLVVTACVFRCEAATTPAFETALGGAVEAAAGVRVGDSKELYSRARGASRLEKTVHAFMSACGRTSGRLTTFAAACDGGREASLDGYPWYRERDLALPAFCGEDELHAACEALPGALAASGIEFLGAHVRIVLSGELNRMIQQGMNKGTLVAGEVGGLLTRVLAASEDERVFAVIDKLGGRHYYGELLRGFFPCVTVAPVMEDPHESVYDIRPEGRRIRVTFAESADARFLPVGLASIFSKYTRELFMCLFNDYWRKLLPGLGRTAGYWTDAKRFLAELSQSLDSEQIPLGLLVRQR